MPAPAPLALSPSPVPRPAWPFTCHRTLAEIAELEALAARDRQGQRGLLRALAPDEQRRLRALRIKGVRAGCGADGCGP